MSAQDPPVADGRFPADRSIHGRAQDMAVKRDYGSFSKACQKHFAPMVSHLGFEPQGGASFARERNGYRDGLFFQQSPWGSGEFCMTAGFNVPALGALLRDEPTFGLLLGRRVGAAGVGDECWLGANDKNELTGSLRTFAGYLDASMSHFDEVQSAADLVFAHGRQEGFGDEPPEQVTHLEQLAVANHGLLLVLAGRAREAQRWIEASISSLKADGLDQYTRPRLLSLEGLASRIRAGEFR